MPNAGFIRLKLLNFMLLGPFNFLYAITHVEFPNVTVMKDILCMMHILVVPWVISGSALTLMSP